MELLAHTLRHLQTLDRIVRLFHMAIRAEVHLLVVGEVVRRLSCTGSGSLRGGPDAEEKAMLEILILAKYGLALAIAVGWAL